MAQARQPAGRLFTNHVMIRGDAGRELGGIPINLTRRVVSKAMTGPAADTNDKQQNDYERL